MTRGRRAKRASEADASKATGSPPDGTTRPDTRAPTSAPVTRHAVFIDVENTSSKAELLGVLDGLGLDAAQARLEISAIGNWRVVGQELARALAERGANLVHSAPVSRVSDWSDLWIAVSAGIWLGTARPGDVLEIVSHDRAFDAVGDAAARLGVAFRRITYRGSGTSSRVSAKSSRASSRRGSRSAKKRSVKRPAASAPAATEPLSAPVDELRKTIGELMRQGAPEGVSLDALTQALKAAGFQRPPGSPRLATRLRRMKDVEVGRGGRVRLIDADAPEAAAASAPAASADATTGSRRRRSSRRRGGRRRGRRGKGNAGAS